MKKKKNKKKLEQLSECSLNEFCAEIDIRFLRDLDEDRRL